MIDTKPLILQPILSRVHPVTNEVVSELRWKWGWRYLPMFGARTAPWVRSKHVSMALRTDYEWFFWIDDDNWAPTEDFVRLFRLAQEKDLDAVAYPYVCRRTSKPIINFAPVDPKQELRVGEEGGLVEAARIAFSCTFTHRRLFERIAEILPKVTYDEAGDAVPGWPFFSELIENGHHYGDDYSCSIRARLTGSKLWVDTRVMAQHAAETVLTGEEVLAP